MKQIRTDENANKQVDKFRSKTDALAEISDRLYEYLIKRLQIGEEKTRRNIIDLEEYLYKCVDADTIDDVLENQGVPSFLRQVATVECYIDGAIREPCDIWEKDENNKWVIYESGHRFELFVLAPYQYLAYNTTDGYWEVETDDVEYVKSELDRKYWGFEDDFFKMTCDLDEVRRRLYEFLKVKFGFEKDEDLEKFIYKVNENMNNGLLDEDVVLDGEVAWFLENINGCNVETRVDCDGEKKIGRIWFEESVSAPTSKSDSADEDDLPF